MNFPIFKINTIRNVVFCAVLHRLLGLGSNLNVFHSSPPPASSSSAALNLSFAYSFVQNELPSLTAPPHSSHWTLQLNRAKISREAVALVPQNELWFFTFCFSLFSDCFSTWFLRHPHITEMTAVMFTWRAEISQGFLHDITGFLQQSCEAETDLEVLPSSLSK